MIFIESLLSHAGLLNTLTVQPSVACINTTRPIYLVFGENSEHPLYVIRKIDDERGLKSSQVDRSIHQLAGNLVPAPLGIYEFNGATYDIQCGVSGYPWFQLKARVQSDEARSQIENRMWQSLDDFHTAVGAAQTDGAVMIEPHVELQKALSAYRSTGEKFTDRLQTLTEEASQELFYSPNCSPVPQHGDFCLNNLIIDKVHITVIDFEDFEITKMPLYDAFTLALTLPSFDNTPENAAQLFTHPAIINAASLYGVPEKAIRWHFLHHLLLRLGPWSAGEKRGRYRAWLHKVLDKFVDDQEKN